MYTYTYKYMKGIFYIEKLQSNILPIVLINLTLSLNHFSSVHLFVVMRTFQFQYT